MKQAEAEMVVEYYADIPKKLKLLWKRRDELEDEINTIHGVQWDGMPRSSVPGDSVATAAMRMERLGVTDQLNELEKEAATLKADAALVRGQIDALNSVHSEILLQRYYYGHSWEQVAEGLAYSVQHTKRLRNMALVLLGQRLDHCVERDALLTRAYNARKVPWKYAAPELDEDDD